MEQSKCGIRLYNLFPRIVGSIPRWEEQVDRIKDMGFNAIWVNPSHYAGFSGSLYSPKDYYRIADMFIDNSIDVAPFDQLKSFIKKCHDCNIKFIMDLVINHTAIDCDLIKEHKNWYKLDENGKIINPGAMHDGVWHAWGDLAEVNNLNSPDRDNLWNFWWKMMKYYLDMGVDGFRCDMAYQVPSDLWRFLIPKSREVKSDCLFLAESLGCDFKQVQELANLGFDYLFNSSKYWDFNEFWGMEQYHKTSQIVKTISFPESHDTVRMITETNGDIAAIKRQLLFSAVFSAGYMIPIGFEFGFTKQLNVVQTQPDWWENTLINFTEYIKKINALKDKYPVLNVEPGIEIVDQANWANVFCFKKTMPNEKSILVMLNKDTTQYQNIFIPDLTSILGENGIVDISPEYAMNYLPYSFDYHLRPSEVKILAQK